MKINILIFKYASLLCILLMIGCNNDSSDVGQVKRDAKTLKMYGPEVKVHKENIASENMYPKYGEEQTLAAIAADYLGRSVDVLHISKRKKEFKPDYIEYQLEVEDLPVDLKNLSTIFTKKDRIESKGKNENVVIEFAKKDDLGVRSQHTMIVNFSPLANSEEPKVTYGFDKKKGSGKKKLHIKKIKSSAFKFEGKESKYFIGAKKPFASQSIQLDYQLNSKQYAYQTDTGNGVLDMDRLQQYTIGNKEPISDDMKYGAIVNNLKVAQNKYIKSGGYYKVDGLLRVLPNIELYADYPLRDMYKGEGLMKHNGTSLSDGQSYIKLTMDDTQIGLLIDVDGYISQYQQVIVDKAKGIVEKTVLIRA